MNRSQADRLALAVRSVATTKVDATPRDKDAALANECLRVLSDALLDVFGRDRERNPGMEEKPEKDDVPKDEPHAVHHASTRPVAHAAHKANHGKK